MPHRAQSRTVAAQWREVLPTIQTERRQRESVRCEIAACIHASSLQHFSGRRCGPPARLRRGRSGLASRGRTGKEVDLAAIENGAQVLNCSDMFFGPKPT